MSLKTNFILLLLISVLLVVFIGYLTKNNVKKSTEPNLETTQEVNEKDIFQGVGYVPIDPKKFEVSILSSSLLAPTRIKITPDGKFLLVSQITGEVLAFRRNGNTWDTTPKHLIKVETKFPGFPPDEAGLVGLIFSNRYTENGKLFLLYTFKDSEGKTQNRISVTTLSQKDDNLVATDPKLIYQANVAGTGSHQITDGISVDIQDKSHLLFMVGEGFDGKRAQDPKLEGGKLLLVQEDGSNPVGERPYPENPKVQALGIRNGFVLAENPLDSKKRILITDTGPDHFDRLIFTNPLNQEGKSIKPINFGWDGSEEKLKNPIFDPNDKTVNDMVIHRFPDTLTFSGLVFHPGKGVIQKSNPTSQSFLVTLFGKTGSKDNEPGKQILLARLSNLSGQPKVSFTTLIKRNPDAQGKLGNPIGLEVDSQTGDFFFLDILEGKLYRVTEGGD